MITCFRRHYHNIFAKTRSGMTMTRQIHLQTLRKRLPLPHWTVQPAYCISRTGLNWTGLDREIQYAASENAV